MEETILLGRGKEIIGIPRRTWEEHLTHVPEHTKDRLRFMNEEHHLVRNFVVREMVARGRAIPLDEISQELEIDLPRVLTIVEDLEKHLFFLVRNEVGEIFWAYPFTVEETRHRLSFRSGEKLYAA
jgi:hypothetical protein